jgi:hypothetical protein
MNSGILNFALRRSTARIMENKGDCSLNDYDGNCEAETDSGSSISTESSQRTSPTESSPEASQTSGSSDNSWSCKQNVSLPDGRQNKSGALNAKQLPKRRTSPMELWMENQCDRDQDARLRKMGQCQRANMIASARGGRRRKSPFSSSEPEPEENADPGTPSLKDTNCNLNGNSRIGAVKDMITGKKETDDDPAVREIALLRAKGQHKRADQMEQLRKQIR